MARRRLILAAASPRVRAALIVLAVALTAGLAANAIPKLLQRLDYFRVRRVEIAGLQYLAPGKVIAALGLESNATVFDDLAAPARQLAALPGVMSAHVERRLPGTLEIQVLEALPVALAPRSSGLALLDSSGNVLPFDPAVAAPDLPVAATADRRIARVLAQVQEHDPELFARVRTAWRVRDDVLLDVDGRRLWFGPAVTAEDIRAVMAVVQDLARQGRSFQELDGRYAGQVIVRAGA
ncbi:MAG TPA: FtsQ-type POTRA domain-containing protein [Gemmatimonadales bacterium]|nr:FtsQ-type POTRA domain-containing protein [Gemmatimonadales bacterium]